MAAATSLPISRLTDLGIPIAWQEAVAVVSAVDACSAATGIPIALEHCHLTLAGEVHLSRPGPGQPQRTVSSLDLLVALLDGQASAADLRMLAVGVAEPCPGEEGPHLRADVGWCLSRDPTMDVARLAARALAADFGARSEPSTEAADAAARSAAAAGMPCPERPVKDRPAVTVRVPRVTPGMALAMAAVLATVVGGAALIGARLGAVEWRWISSITPGHVVSPSQADAPRAASRPSSRRRAAASTRADGYPRR